MTQDTGLMHTHQNNRCDGAHTGHWPLATHATATARSLSRATKTTIRRTPHLPYALHAGTGAVPRSLSTEACSRSMLLSTSAEGVPAVQRAGEVDV